MKEENFTLDPAEMDGLKKEELEGPDVGDDNKTVELPYTLELAYPVELTKRKTVTELVFSNRIKGAYLEHLPVDAEMGSLKMGHFFPIVAGMTAENVGTIRRLDRVDLMQCIKVITPFLSEDGEE